MVLHNGAQRHIHGRPTAEKPCLRRQHDSILCCYNRALSVITINKAEHVPEKSCGSCKGCGMSKGMDVKGHSMALLILLDKDRPADTTCCRCRESKEKIA